MRTEQIKVYTFDELSSEAQKTVLERFSDINVNFDWWEYILEEAASKLQKLGLKGVDKDNIGFNLGRGAHTSIPLTKAHIQFTSQEGVEYYASLQEGIKQFGAFYTEFPSMGWRTSEIRPWVEEVVLKDGTVLDEDIPQKHIDRVYEQYSKALEVLKDTHKRLEEDYEYNISEEAIKDTLVANDFEFLEDGRIYK